MKSWKKIALGGASVLALATLAACGSSASSNKSSSSSSSDSIKGTVRVYVDTQQKATYTDVAKGLTSKYPDLKVQIIANASGSANAKTDIAKDPSKYADVFAVPNDQLGDLADKGFISPVATKFADEIKNDNSKITVAGVTYKDKVYAFPKSTEAQVLFYNKSKLSADDVKSWDTMTSKAVFATDFTNAYNFYPVFFSAGTQLFGASGEDVTGTNVASDKGVTAMKWFADQKANKNVMQTSNALNQLQSGKADAIIDGPWDTANIKKILGDNFAVAPYPTITLNGEQKQLEAFQGIKGFAVNSATKDQAASQTVAQYLTTKAAQLKLFNSQGDVPTNLDAQKDDAVKSSDATKAVITMAKEGNSVVMPKLPQMATFWNNAAPLINGAYTGSIKATDYQAQLQKFQDSISK
ncbi:extracellular solute-binding protein [Lactococcus cremoris]|jgi:arabinogalactan oligomer/maltooligosaccharide transport system substrate-binding protein|uniref:Sugar ABC transporter substrate-binding protein n=1 Tax=Lactococcus cremoris subsp. cremoris IBB477 TaxID=1449093 RepID=A0A1E7G5C2_LACLC|nr:extracellular solute-binding protein [Lactococcus cremoris]MCI1841450.1 extracellular solute-binding protein [Lactococcus lactis]KZK10115.1 Maltose/maltodextrin ABC transporter substrate binding periplasmic protein MalE [Lactococcus cremoris]MCT0456638.1 extracellular solute-binding protein [Lactococcus cremoris]MCT0474903.1 extracellular solute-binding protein [Lactococcus cremoris]MCT0478305.1 extracellular solute-binding protein [Lactococcus cremoris]